MNVGTAWANVGLATIRGALLQAGTSLLPAKNSARSGLLYQSVDYEIGTLTLVSGIAQDILPLPTIAFDGEITLMIGKYGHARFRVSWNGTTFASTPLATSFVAEVANPVLSKNGTQLAVTFFVANSGTATTFRCQAIIDGLIY